MLQGFIPASSSLTKEKMLDLTLRTGIEISGLVTDYNQVRNCNYPDQE
jgi:hypothetical protein